MKNETGITVTLSVLLLVVSVASLFVGVWDITPADVLAGDIEQIQVLLISHRTAVYEKLHHMGQGVVFRRLCHSWNMDLHMLHSTY